MTLGATTSGLAHIASLTNNELFTEVIAEINRSFKKEKKSNKKKDWQRIALKVATSAAKGEEEGYSCADDWVTQFNRLSSDEDGTVSQASNFREALNSLPSDCYRRRLDNALSAIASSSHSTDLSVKQVAGLIRGCSFLTSSESDVDTDIKNIQARVISHLVKSMPQLASNPFDIFYAVQLPLLQKLNYDTFIKGGMKFASQDSETEFISLLNLDLSEQQGEHEYKVGEKRKRISDDNTNNKIDTCSPITDVSSKTIHHVLEAAYLARKGAVRAQHGAVIYIKDGDTTKVIGRGWNHDYLLDPSASASKKNKIVLHSEVHAVVDSISKYGEDECFDKLFPMAYIMIVELESDYAYDTCHPCPKCDPMLRAVGITKVLHTTPYGKIEELDLGLANYDLLTNENVYTHLIAACDERKITCKRLQLKCRDVKGLSIYRH